MSFFRTALQILGLTGLFMLLIGCGGDNDTSSSKTYYGNNGWQLAWSDEFSGSAVDEDKWDWLEDCWGGGNNEQQCYTNRIDNSYVSNGKLVIRAHQETFTGAAEPQDWNTNAGLKTLPYTSARLRTKGKGDWKYGRIEVRAKLPAGQGIWPAIWMLPSHNVYGEWAASGESDIVEAINIQPTIASTHQIHGTLHFGGGWPNNVHMGSSYTLVDSDPSQNFHTYAIDWAEDEIRWYVDGTLYGSNTSASWYSIPNTAAVAGPNAPFDQDFHIILNVAVGGQWPGAPDANTNFPVQMEIDYVRFYNCSASPSSLDTCQ